MPAIAPADIIKTYGPDFAGMGLTATVAGDAVQLATPNQAHAWAAGQLLSPAIQGVKLLAPTGGIAPDAGQFDTVTAFAQSIPNVHLLQPYQSDPLEPGALQVYVGGADAAEAAANIAHVQPLLNPTYNGMTLQYQADVPFQAISGDGSSAHPV